MAQVRERIVASGIVIGPLLSLLLCSAGANAEDRPGPCDPPNPNLSASDLAALNDEAKHVDCDNAGDQRSANLCAWIKLTESESRLKSANDKLMSLFATDDDRSNFAVAQEAWCNYRNKICDYERKGFSHGTMAGMVWGECKQAYDDARATALSAMARCIKEDNCGHPALFFPLELNQQGQYP